MESSRVEKRLDDEGWGEIKGKTGRPEEKALASYFGISSLVPRWNFTERAEGLQETTTEDGGITVQTKQSQRLRNRVAKFEGEGESPWAEPKADSGNPGVISGSYGQENYKETENYFTKRKCN